MYDLVYTTETQPPRVEIDYGPEQTHCELDDPETGLVCGRRLTSIRRLCPLHDRPSGWLSIPSARCIGPAMIDEPMQCRCAACSPVSITPTTTA